MAFYEIYATKINLAAFLGISENQLPEDSERLLKRASEVIQQSTLSKIDLNKEVHVEIAQLATCAQVEYWINMSESSAISGSVSSFSLGDLSMNMSESTNKGMLSPRAKSYLNSCGLLYRGVRFSGKGVQEV